MFDLFNSNASSTEDIIVVKARKPGVESVSGVALPLDLVGDGALGGADTLVDVGAAGLGGAAAYGAILRALNLIPLLRNKQITRTEFTRQVANAAGSGAKRAVVPALAVGAVLALIPGLYPIIGIAGLVGGGAMLWRISESVIDAFTDEQKAELKKAAEKAGVAVKGITDVGTRTNGKGLAY